MRDGARKTWDDRLDSWIAKGWVNADHRQDILDDIAGPSKAGGPGLLILLGVVLLLFGVVSMLASNWEMIPRPVRLIVLVSSLGASYLGAWVALRKPGHEGVGHSLMLLGAGLFGVNVMLIAQMYHIDEHAPTGVLAWALGALAASMVASSRPPLWLAMGLIALWSGWEMIEFYGTPPHVWFLVPWAMALGWAWRHDWSVEMRGAWVAFFVWYGIALGAMDNIVGWRDGDIIAVAALLPAALWLIAQGLDRKENPWAGTLSALSLYGVIFLPTVLAVETLTTDAMALWPISLGVCVMGYGGLLLWLWKQGKGSYGLLSVPLIAMLGPLNIAFYGFDHAAYWGTLGAALALLVLLTAWASRMGDRVTLVAAFLGFSGLAVVIYMNDDWSFLARAAFFLIGGLSLIAVAIHGARRKKPVLSAGGAS